jgi:hypothetical protein
MKLQKCSVTDNLIVTGRSDRKNNFSFLPVIQAYLSHQKSGLLEMTISF